MNKDREARRRLHRRLIDIQDRACAMCGSKSNREIHRIRPGRLGGKYLMNNTMVLCRACHDKVHTTQKFAIGDKVTINGRCPKYLVSQLRHNRLRTVVSIYYDADRQCCYYHLGINRLGDVSWDIDAYPFRSYMLHYPLKRLAGRPRTKRQYSISKSTVATPDKPEKAVTAKLIVAYTEPSKTDLVA